MVAAATALLASLAPGLTMTGAGPVCGVANRGGQVGEKGRESL